MFYFFHDKPLIDLIFNFMQHVHSHYLPYTILSIFGFLLKSQEQGWTPPFALSFESLQTKQAKKRLAKEPNESRCCCSCCPDCSCCDWQPDSCCRCCSSYRREERVWFSAYPHWLNTKFLKISFRKRYVSP